MRTDTHTHIIHTYIRADTAARAQLLRTHSQTRAAPHRTTAPRHDGVADEEPADTADGGEVRRRAHSLVGTQALQQHPDTVHDRRPGGDEGCDAIHTRVPTPGVESATSDHSAVTECSVQRLRCTAGSALSGTDHAVVVLTHLHRRRATTGLRTPRRLHASRGPLAPLPARLPLLGRHRGQRQ
jgi:hypothetical protein